MPEASAPSHDMRRDARREAGCDVDFAAPRACRQTPLAVDARVAADANGLRTGAAEAKGGESRTAILGWRRRLEGRLGGNA